MIAAIFSRVYNFTVDNFMRTLKLILIVFLLLLIIIPVNVAAMGNSEDSATYKKKRQQLFLQVIEQVSEKEISSEEAKSRFDTLRNGYNISYTDESGIIDSIIDRSAEGTMTQNEALFYFRLLQEDKLVEYRQENYRQKSDSYQKELLSLLKHQLQTAVTDGSTKNGLRTVLNNYYDFIGLEYDNAYYKLSSLVLALEEGNISAEEIIAELDSLEKQYAQKDIRKQAVEGTPSGETNDYSVQAESSHHSQQTESQHPSTNNGNQNTQKTKE